MKKDITFKTPKPSEFDIVTSGDYFKRYEILKGMTGNSTVIVVDRFVYVGATRLTVKPYKVPKNRLIAILKFMWLKIQVHYS